MPIKPQAIYRTDLLPHRMNAGKEAKVRALLSAWRKVAVRQAREQLGFVAPSNQPCHRSIIFTSIQCHPTETSHRWPNSWRPHSSDLEDGIGYAKPMTPSLNTSKETDFLARR